MLTSVYVEQKEIELNNNALSTLYIQQTLGMIHKKEETQ